MIQLTPKQIGAIHIRLTATCNSIDITRPPGPGRAVEVSQFAHGGRLIETVRIQPGGGVQVL